MGIIVTAVGGDAGEVVWIGAASSRNCDCEGCESRDDYDFGEHLGGLPEDCRVQEIMQGV